MKPNQSRTWTAALLLAGLIAGAACYQQSKAPAPGAGQERDHGHAHERGKMLIADAGKYHALLTAHLSSKEGNELDIFFETTSVKNPKPVALPIESFTAWATTGEGESRELKFEAAPQEERKDDPPGKCSHFVAKAPWMKPNDNLLVVAKVPIDGKDVRIRWTDFNPQKYAHHED
jgi:hypothetical protein